MVSDVELNDQQIGDDESRLLQDSRVRLAGRTTVRGPKFEAVGTLNPEFRTSDRAFLVCLAFHAPLPLADFLRILLVKL